MFKKRVRRSQPTKAKKRVGSDSDEDSDQVAATTHGGILHQGGASKNSKEEVNSQVKFTTNRKRANKTLGLRVGSEWSQVELSKEKSREKFQRHLDAPPQTLSSRFTASDLGTFPHDSEENEIALEASDSANSEQLRQDLKEKLSADIYHDNLSPEHDEWTNTDVIHYQDEHLDTKDSSLRADIVRRKEIQDAMDAAYDEQETVHLGPEDEWESTQLRTAGDKHYEALTEAAASAELQFDPPLSVDQVEQAITSELERLDEERHTLVQSMAVAKSDLENVSQQMEDLERQMLEWVKITFWIYLLQNIL